MTRRQRWAQRLRKPFQRPALLGSIGIVAIAALLAGAVGYTKLGVGKTTYHADFAQAAGIRPGDVVSVAGIPVGAVGGTKLAGDHVEVALSVDSDVPLGRATGASIKLTTLLGARYVELRPAGDGELPDRRITIEHTEVPYDLQATLNDAAVTVDSIDGEQVGKSLNVLATQVEGMPGVLPGLLTNLRSLAAILSERRGEMGALLASSKELTGVLTAQQADLAGVLTTGQDILGQIAARREVVLGLMDATRRLVDQLQTLVGRDRPAVTEMLAGLEGLIGALARNDALLRNLLEILPVPMRNMANATGGGPEVNFSSTGGPLIDSWMCALSGRAQQVGLTPYFKDCQ
ncbi:MCE family protein [Skermania piniformis]|uniref:MCE family protein n=1 Tax=Skermania pinensis TaxID=39122 RepID=A0ABX8SD71_9ACTN|nr:MCE family protein [Skermania piniformis]QXQ15371.1 MCE family protein [Skermania piniformis]